jgi:hypothetical protein
MAAAKYDFRLEISVLPICKNGATKSESRRALTVGTWLAWMWEGTEA